MSEHFEVICTGKDGLRWVTSSPENVGHLISYHYIYIYGKHEHIYPEKQQDIGKKDNGSKQMKGMMQGEGMLNKVNCTLNELAKHSHPMNNISDKL